jgi:hypothetical protein
MHFMKRWSCVLAIGIGVLGAGGCSDDEPTEQTSPTPEVVRATAEKTNRLLRSAVQAAEAEERDELCALGVAITCEGTLARLALSDLEWPSTEPRVVFQGRFGEGTDHSGYAITVCVGEGETERITDFAIYDGIGGSAVNLRDPVYWSGDRLDPVVQAGAPLDCRD